MAFDSIRRDRWVWQSGFSVFLLATTLMCPLFYFGGCQPMHCQLPPELRKERWRIVGRQLSRRVEGQPRDDWIAVLDFPGKTVTRILSDQVPAPDGWKPIAWAVLAYDETSQVTVLCAWRDFIEILLYDLRSKEGKWIGQKRWCDVSCFAWSPNGKKLAFMATSDPDKSENRRGCVYVYDLVTDNLAEVADDGVVGYYGTENGSPVWNKEGTYLYYPLVHRHLARIDLTTLRKEKLPVVADCVLVANGNEIIYVRTDPGAAQGNLKAQVIKSSVHPEHGESDTVLLYTGVELQEKLVSPSGRFILMADRRGYGHGWNVLVDTKTHKSYKYIGSWYIPSLFRISATCRGIERQIRMALK